jgi:hypothetical protein
MKKLFFLCAFLFVSMQMQGQLYIVEAHTDWDYNNADLDYAIIIHQPNGETNVIEISSNEISDSNLGGYTGYSEEYRYSYLKQRLNNELNTIISEGYQLIHITAPNGESFSLWEGHTYFLAAP